MITYSYSCSYYDCDCDCDYDYDCDCDAPPGDRLILDPGCDEDDSDGDWRESAIENHHRLLQLVDYLCNSDLVHTVEDSRQMYENVKEIAFVKQNL